MGNVLLQLLFAASSTSIAIAEAPTYSTAQDPCSKTEAWRFSPSIEPEWRSEFLAFLSGKSGSARSFSEALALRQMASSEESRLFSEYWISRTLLAEGLIHLAHRGFGIVISSAIKPTTLGVQMAALSCMVGLNQMHPTLRLPVETGKHLSTFFQAQPHKLKAYQETVWEAGILAIQDRISLQDSETHSLLPLFKDAGPYQDLAEGLIATQKSESEKAARSFQRFLKVTPLPPSLAKYEDTARLLLARTYFRLGAFKQATYQFRRIQKQSNELADALSEMAWAQLMSENHKAAIGTTINLQSGGMRKTFTPEAPMVMAMALNELCHYPESVRAVEIFRNNYQSSHNWLETWSKNKEKSNLYQLAVNYIKHDTSPVPDRIATEWIRSPLFFSRQDEINAIFKQKRATAAIGKQGAKEQARLATQLLNMARDLKPRYLQAKIQLRPNEALPKSIQEQLHSLQKQATHYRRYRAAAPIWRQVLASHKKASSERIQTLTADINKDLTKITQRMYDQLLDVAENNYFIEVEIYNGASEDIIWKNAYPDYEEVAKKFKEESRSPAASKSWNWGNVTAGLDGSGEIWEDELGAFKAELFDNCSSKDKYLAIKSNDVLKANFKK